MVTYWTGNDCQIPGTYESDCECARVIALRTGEEFPPCAECSQVVSWELLAAADEESRRLRR
jgi:hypothetical protein